MGINLSILEYIYTYLKKTNLEGLNICLFGNLYMRKDTNQPYKTAMEYFESLGMEVTCIDINGKDGALPIDLSKEIPKKLKNKFDVLINGGTIEHVSNQYQCFKNAHDLCKEKAFLFHVAPEIGSWPKHCIHWYTYEFFKYLSIENNYFNLNIRKNYRSGSLRGNLLYAAMIKLDNYEFMLDYPFKLLFERTAK